MSWRGEGRGFFECVLGVGGVDVLEPVVGGVGEGGDGLYFVGSMSVVGGEGGGDGSGDGSVSISVEGEREHGRAGVGGDAESSGLAVVGGIAGVCCASESTNVCVLVLVPRPRDGLLLLLSFMEAGRGLDMARLRIAQRAARRSRQLGQSCVSLGLQLRLVLEGGGGSLSSPVPVRAGEISKAW